MKIIQFDMHKHPKPPQKTATLSINMHKLDTAAYILSKYYYQENFLGYRYLKLRASRYPSHACGAGPSRSQAHGRPWFLIPIPQKVLLTLVVQLIYQTSLRM